MKKDFVEYLGFEDDVPKKVGRPKLADKETKKKNLIIASVSFCSVLLLLIFGYGTLFGFNNTKLFATSSNHDNINNNNGSILIEEIKALNKDISIKVGSKRKLYLTVSPASASNKKINYKSSNNSVAIVDKNGIVTAIKEGSAVITAETNDGTNKTTEFYIKALKNSSGTCSIKVLDRTSSGIVYNLECDNAKIKEIQYKIGNGDYEALLTKKLSDSVKFSSKQLKKNLTLKVVYYPNNSKITKYVTKTLNNIMTTKEKTGTCFLTLERVESNSARYDVTCENATVNKIAYKIGNGSYVGIDTSSLADTILFEESNVTRQLYFNIEYQIDGTKKIKTITKSNIIPNSTSITRSNSNDANSNTTN